MYFLHLLFYNVCQKSSHAVHCMFRKISVMEVGFIIPVISQLLVEICIYLTVNAKNVVPSQYQSLVVNGDGEGIPHIFKFQSNSSKLVMLLTCVTINAHSSYTLNYHYILSCHIKHEKSIVPFSSCIVGFFWGVEISF